MSGEAVEEKFNIFKPEAAGFSDIACAVLFYFQK